MKKIILISLLLLSIKVMAQKDTSLVKFINPSSVHTSKGYSQAVVINMGNSQMVVISGQVALDSLGNLVGAADMAKQTEQVFTNIKNILKSLGGNMENVIKLGYFTTDVSQIQAVRAGRDKFINLKNPPASTLVQVSKLFRNDILIEIEATAIIPVKQQ